MQYSQEHLKTMVYAKFGGQTECIMGNWKIENIRNSGFQNLKGLESRIQVPLTKTGIKYLESGIHGVDSRIQSILDSFTWGDYVHDYVPTQLAIR